MTKAGAVSFDVLAENYRSEAELCRRMAAATSGSQKDEWLRLSAEFIRLAKEANAQCGGLLERRVSPSRTIANRGTNGDCTAQALTWVAHTAPSAAANPFKPRF
jgi:hypothetical protein